MYKLLSKASNTMVNIGVFNIFFPVDVLINSIIGIGIILKLQYCIVI